MISVITPAHPPHYRFLKESYRSLLEQVHEDWEWILGFDGVAPTPDQLRFDDDRIKPFHQPHTDSNKPYKPIGLLKSECARRAEGDIIVELDADDLLHPVCLTELKHAFSNANVAMAYSNDAMFKDGTWEECTFDDGNGWRYRPVMYQGHKLQEILHHPVTPHSLRSVLWSPDHVRAWRTAAYQQIGGHNATLQNGDDHELTCRMYMQYGADAIKHIDQCLYFYRRHAGNTCQIHNADVFSQVDKNYCDYRTRILNRWAVDRQLRRLDLGGRFNAWPDYEIVDIEGDPRLGHIIADLESDWPFEENSIGVIRAAHIFEHLRDPIHAMNEAYRVLIPGGWLLVEVPSTDGRGAFQDPTHVSFWNENSFWYYTNEDYARFIKPRYKGRFQLARSATFFPSEFEKQHNVCWTQADMIALKPPYDRFAPGSQLI